MIFLVSLGAFFATLIGGLFALRYKDKLHLILGFSAGAVIGVAFFDLLPEALELAGEVWSFSVVTSTVALGFVLFMLFDRFLMNHTHGDHCEHPHHSRGTLAAGSLSFHSLLDGVAIGLAFQVSSALGAVVTLAVLTHDFSDGINTVALILKSGGERSKVFRWLFLDALAPVVGVLSTLVFRVEGSSLGLLLALFCGFFLYIGASDLLPESHHAHPTHWTTFMTVLGVAVLFAAVRLAGI